MNVHVTIRTATIDDLPAVSQLLHELDDLHVRNHPDVFQPFDDPIQMKERAARFTEAVDGDILLALVGTDIVGLATIRIASNPDAPMFRCRQCTVMDNLIVDQKHRGMGIGKLLLDCAADWTRSREVPLIDINVWIDNETGTSFFKANGFAPLCQRMELRVDEEC